MLLLEEIKCWATKVPCSCFFPLECIQAHPKIKSLPGEREAIGLHSETTEGGPNLETARVRGSPAFQTDILSPTFPLILFSWSFRIAEYI